MAKILITDNNMEKYVIGVDFGTLSGRSLLVNVKTGEETSTAVYEYRHGVMDETLPDGTKLGVDWALQHPQDYLDTLAKTIPAVIKEAGIEAEAVIGIGIDFTACTVLPVKADGEPLCFDKSLSSNPHSWVKLWKHHAAHV